MGKSISEIQQIKGLEKYVVQSEEATSEMTLNNMDYQESEKNT